MDDFIILLCVVNLTIDSSIKLIKELRKLKNRLK